MTKSIKNIGNPSEFWDYFEQISKIPRCSSDESRIRAYIKGVAENFNFDTKIDNFGNLVVKIPPINQEKNKVTLILQSHMDMVCEKNESVDHDFSKDSLKLKVIEINGDKWLTAEGTTLGADNGVGLAYSLTLMKKIFNKELNFNSLSLDLLFTVQEEVGLIGASQLGKDMIEGDYLINLDSEDDDVITIGCAGGMNLTIEIGLERTKLNSNEDSLIPIKIKISGLRGGHSGVDIHEKRANAIKLVSFILKKLSQHFVIQLYSIQGGNLTNAIPRESQVILFCRKDNFSNIDKFIHELDFKELDFAFEQEKDLNILIEKLDNDVKNEPIDSNFQEELIKILNLMPHGPISMHPDIKGLVFTSSNFATIKTSRKKIKIEISNRSFEPAPLRENSEKISELFQNVPFKVKIKEYGGYGGWNPDFNSKLVKIAKEVYQKSFNEEVRIRAIHAGLECGVIKNKFPDLEMISIGPLGFGAHSPDERLDIRSIEKVWKFLINLIQSIEKST